MGTRGFIARRTEAGFAGRYHNWDSYPDGLGKSLWRAYHGRFSGDLEALLRFLIDEHPAGWSSIVRADFGQPAGYGGGGPECYCHGGSRGERQDIDQTNAGGSGCEWGYVLYRDGAGAARMVIARSFYGGAPRAGEPMVGLFGKGDAGAEWRAVHDLPLDGPEPDWEKVAPLPR